MRSNPRTIENKARRHARRCDLLMRKSRRGISLDNHGEFMLVDLYRNFPVAGFQYDMTPDEVIEYCNDEASVAA